MLLNISDFNLFLCENCNPPEKKSPSLSQQPPLKVKVLSSPPPPFWKISWRLNLPLSTIPTPLQKGEGAHYVSSGSSIGKDIDRSNFVQKTIWFDLWDSVSEEFSILIILKLKPSNIVYIIQPPLCFTSLPWLLQTFGKETALLLCNNFPCISSFPCARLKIVAMAYIRVITNTIELLFPTFYLCCHSLSVSLVFHESFLLICLVPVLLSV